MDLERLIALREIEELKYRYVRTLDEKDWEGFRSVFTDDATGDYGERLRLVGADAIVEALSGMLGPDMITLHQVHQPEIEIDGDDAVGTWALQDRVIMTGRRLILEGSSFYRDGYRRGPDGRWLVCRTGYTRQYEHVVSFDDLPSFELLANRFGGPAGA